MAVTPSDADLAAVNRLSGRFGALSDTLVRSIQQRPMRGKLGSPYSADFDPKHLEERTLLTFAIPGALGLLQACRGNARALQLLYASAGPALVDPAPFELMRGIWERALLVTWLMDNGISPAMRVGRLKGWVEVGLLRAGQGPEALSGATQAEISEMLRGCSEPAVRPPSTTHLSMMHGDIGETTYRKLSGILHARVWSVVPAFEMSARDGGHVIGWRGYHLALHEELSFAVVESAERAMHVVTGYFASP